ncbi:hypothetical protein [Methylobacillus sp. Pita1]|uniref:hypothetical protein n=1 Tax=Methylobacillus sp. Pita1 TaxID=3382642 RepID=UPI0038B465DA
MDILITGIVVVAVTYLAWQWLFNRASVKPRPSRPSPSSRGDLDNAMSRLVTACRGDKAKAQRLVEYERKNNPAIRTIDAIQNAFDRLERDRQR